MKGYWKGENEQNRLDFEIVALFENSLDRLIVSLMHNMLLRQKQQEGDGSLVISK